LELNSDKAVLADESELLLTPGAKQLADCLTADVVIPLKSLSSEKEQDIETLGIHYRESISQPKLAKKFGSSHVCVES
jgi:hypothetical protein